MFLLVTSAFVKCDSLIVFTQFFLHELINNAFIRKINVVIHAKLILFVKEHQLMKSRSKKKNTNPIHVRCRITFGKFHIHYNNKIS